MTIAELISALSAIPNKSQEVLIGWDEESPVDELAEPSIDIYDEEAGQPGFIVLVPAA